MDDIVYICRPGEDNEELRYSLRSVHECLPPARIWVAGHCPRWVRGIDRIELHPLQDKFDNQRQSLLAACADDRISEHFWLLNDDMFVMSSIAAIPTYHVGPVFEYIAHLFEIGKPPRERWFTGIRHTLEQLIAWGYEHPLCYEAHTPLRFERARLGELLDAAMVRPFLWGAGYTATDGAIGVRGRDAKVWATSREQYLARLDHAPPFLSTNDDTFANGYVGKQIREHFWRISPYEA